MEGDETPISLQYQNVHWVKHGLTETRSTSVKENLFSLVFMIISANLLNSVGAWFTD